MKTINIIETAEELIALAEPHQIEGDRKPFLGCEAKLIFENDMTTIRLEGVEDTFQLSGDITAEAVVQALAEKSHFGVYIT